MNAGWVAARAGVRRGWIELKHTFTTPNDLVTLLIFTAILLGVMLWTRTTTVPGTHFSLGTAMLASMIGMTVGFNGLATLGGILTVEREDGTLLRAKATPNGMTGYLIGKVVTVLGTILISVVTTLVVGALLFSGLAVGSASTCGELGIRFRLLERRLLRRGGLIRRVHPRGEDLARRLAVDGRAVLGQQRRMPPPPRRSRHPASAT